MKRGLDTTVDAGRFVPGEGLGGPRLRQKYPMGPGNSNAALLETTAHCETWGMKEKYPPTGARKIASPHREAH